MALDREALYAALFARLQSKLSGSITTFSRRWLDFDRLSVSQQPALMSLATTGHPDYGAPTPLPPRHFLQGMIVVYVRTQPDVAAGPETQLLQLVQAVESALEVQPTEGHQPEYSTTLGGLVEWCRISGEIEIHPGADADQAAAVIPFQMLALR